jgi:hypothetical protein
MRNGTWFKAVANCTYLVGRIQIDGTSKLVFLGYFFGSGPHTFFYAMPSSPGDDVVGLVSTGVPVGAGDPRPLGVSPAQATVVCVCVCYT